MADKLAKAKLARAAHRLNGKSRLPALVLMTDDTRLADPMAAARALPRGSMVIVRSRDAAVRQRLTIALKSLARSRKLKILVADDPRLAAQADGLHLPRMRAHNAAHWRALHPKWIITVAAHASDIHARYADAVLLSPIFPTASHPGAADIGATRARIIARTSGVPVYALGGIHSGNVAGLRHFIGIAAISALA